MAFDLCHCDTIEINYQEHAEPQLFERSFEVARDLMEAAPDCDRIHIEDHGCSIFAHANTALSEARKLAVDAVAAGYEGTITIQGNQTVNNTLTLDGEILFEYVKSTANLIGRIKTTINRKQIKELIDESQRQCRASYSSPIQYNVCEEGVTVSLSPCKEVGSISAVDKRDNGGAATIACEQDGKWMNQSCEPTDSEEAYQSYAGTNSDSVQAGISTLCEWQEPALCK
jgi:hypothetical protein